MYMLFKKTKQARRLYTLLMVGDNKSLNFFCPLFLSIILLIIVKTCNDVRCLEKIRNEGFLSYYSSHTRESNIVSAVGLLNTILL